MKRIIFLLLCTTFLACSNDKSDTEDEANPKNDSIFLGNWSRSFSFAGMKRNGAVVFNIKDNQGKEYVYVGLGRNIENSERDKTLRDFWQFDGKNWVQVDSFPKAAQGRYGAIAFVIGKKAYVGTGFKDKTHNYDEDHYFNDFWEFDPHQPAGQQWSTQAVTKLPAEGRQGAVAFSLNGKGYVGTGLADGHALKDFWEYDPVTLQWTASSFSGEERSGAVAFILDNKAVVCLGTDPMHTSDYKRDINIFDPSVSNEKDRWKTSANSLRNQEGRSWDDDYDQIPRAYAVAFTSSLGGIEKGYIATGIGPYTRTCWEYNLQEDRWHKVAELPSTMIHRMCAVGFTLNNYGYVTTGGMGYNPIDPDTWKFTPGVRKDNSD